MNIGKWIRNGLILVLGLTFSQAQFINPSLTNINFVPNFSTLTPPPLNLNISKSFVLSNFVNQSNISQLDLTKPLFQTTKVDDFKKYIVLPNGLVLNLNVDRLKKIIDARNLEKVKYSIYKDSLNLPSMQFLDPKMQIFPDRVKIVFPTKVKFNDISQLENVVKYFPEVKFTLGPDQLKQFVQDIVSKRCSMPRRDNVCANLTEDKINQIIEKFNDPNLVKTITITETVEYSLMPQIYFGITGINFHLKNSLLLNSPTNTYLFRNNFINKWNNSKKSASIINNFLINSNFQLVYPSGSIDETAKRWCQQAYSGFDNAINKCIDQLKERLQKGRYTGEDTLIFGFTIGQEWSYTLDDSWSIDYVGEIYNFAVQFVAGYGVGLRLPVKVAYSIDNIKEGTDKDVKLKIKISGTDLSGAEYEKLGLPKNLVFSGEEFVLQADNYLVFKKLSLFGEDLLDNSINLDLIPIYKWLLEQAGININKILSGDKLNISKDFKTPVGRKNADEYGDFDELYDNDYWHLPTGWERVILYNTGLVEGELFPKAASKVMSLPDWLVEVGDYIKLLAELGADVGFAGTEIAFNIDLHNLSKNGAHQIEYRIDEGDREYPIDLYVVPWANDKKDNYLGEYYNFGASLSGWNYQPAIVLTLWGKLKVKIHTKWKDKTYSSPKLDLFSLVFNLSSDTDIPELNIEAGRFKLHPGTAQSIDFKNVGKYYPLRQYIPQPTLCACIQIGRDVMCGDMLLNEYNSLKRQLRKNIYECPDDLGKNIPENETNSRMRGGVSTGAGNTGASYSGEIKLPKLKWVGTIDLTANMNRIRVGSGEVSIAIEGQTPGGANNGTESGNANFSGNASISGTNTFQGQGGSEVDLMGGVSGAGGNMNSIDQKINEAKIVLGAKLVKKIDYILQKRLYSKLSKKPVSKQIALLKKINKKINRLKNKYKNRPKAIALLDYLYYSFEKKIAELTD